MNWGRARAANCRHSARSGRNDVIKRAASARRPHTTRHDCSIAGSQAANGGPEPPCARMNAPFVRVSICLNPGNKAATAALPQPSGHGQVGRPSRGSPRTPSAACATPAWRHSRPRRPQPGPEPIPCGSSLPLFPRVYMRGLAAPDIWQCLAGAPWRTFEFSENCSRGPGHRQFLCLWPFGRTYHTRINRFPVTTATSPGVPVTSHSLPPDAMTPPCRVCTRRHRRQSSALLKFRGIQSTMTFAGRLGRTQLAPLRPAFV